MEDNERRIGIAGIVGVGVVRTKTLGSSDFYLLRPESCIYYPSSKLPWLPDARRGVKRRL